MTGVQTCASDLFINHTANTFSTAFATNPTTRSFESIAYASATQAHNDLLIGNLLDYNNYCQTAISFGHTVDPLRKLHIGSANNASFDSTTVFTPTMTITSGGSIGIGTNSPNYKLSTNGVGNFYSSVAGLGRIFLGDPADPGGYIGIYRSGLGPSN